ncbi:LysM peptidoglycan-binding domain-containing protein [Streptomyces sp. NBC_01012]|nr:LysM peptidoglycan-binding domain-containing protein [Streptomyces sp. NBC_01012]
MGAWPTCGRLGASGTSSSSSSGGSSAAGVDGSDSAQAAPERQSTGSSNSGSSGSASSGSTAGSTEDSDHSTAGDSGVKHYSEDLVEEESYVVEPGDCLSTIAERADVSGGWTALYELNREVLDHGPHLIFPGQRLQLDA